MDDMTILLLAIPIVVIQLALMIRNLIHVRKVTKTKYLSKTIWVLIILFGNLIGNIVYMIIGGDNDDSD